MVKKELDAALLQQLKDEHVSLLPYVENQELRPQLRSDLQSLQIPVFNGENYTALLPCVAAEIWRSYLERMLAIGVQSEKLKRLEAERKLHDLESAKGEGIFSTSEERDFQHIRGRLGRYEKVEVIALTKAQGKQEQGSEQHLFFEVELLSLIPPITGSKEWEYSNHLALRTLEDTLCPIILDEKSEFAGTALSISQYPQLADEFLMYGFVRRVYRESAGSERLRGMLSGFSLSNAHHFEYTEKVERFKHWLLYHGKFPAEIKWRPAVAQPEQSAVKANEVG